MNPTKEFLKKYLEDEAPSEILNNSFRDVLPVGEVVVDSIHHDCVGGARACVSVTEEGDDFADTYIIKILFIDMLVYIYQELQKCNTQQ